MEIQGDGDASPEVGNRVVTEGVVTAVFADLDGFFIADTLGDDNPETSDGLFVASASNLPVVGEYVLLTGTVREESRRTQLASVTEVEVLSSGNAIMPTTVSFPVIDFERYEGMYIVFDEALQVIGNRNLTNFGEVTLASSIQYTTSQILDANDDPVTGNSFSGSDQVEGLETLGGLNFRSRLVLDDGTDNVLGEGDAPVYGAFLSPGIPGTQVTNVVGVLHYDFGRYALEPTNSPSFSLTENHEIEPVPEGANLSVATFNVENFFNGNGEGGGFGDRGPGSQVEFEIQRSKVTAAILALNADIIGLQELENDGGGANSSLASLLASVNDAAGTALYAAIYDVPGQGNTGSIRNAFLYRTDRVEAVGDPIADPDPIHLRVPITQRFRLLSNEAEVWVCNVHHRSKSCSSASGDNQDEGQGCYNALRQEQMAAVWQWLDTEMANSEVATAIMLGDYNSYAQEDPVDFMRAQGWQAVLSDSSYTYVFEDQRGSLDQLMVSPALVAGLLQAQPWHINADYPSGFKFLASGGGQELLYRSSDHDPILAHFQLEPGMNRQGLPARLRPELQASLYPNPTSRDARLLLNQRHSQVVIQAVDLQGKQVWQREYAEVSRVKIPSRNWPSGVYLITVTADGSSQQLQMVKED